jgi:DNA mismatch repair ATPase MutS
MNDHSPHDIYVKQKAKHEAQLQMLRKKQNQFGWLRLGVILAIALIGYYTFSYWGVWGWLVVVIGIAVFLWIVSKDATNNEAIENEKALVDINKEELHVLNDSYHERFDGKQFEPKVHPYAADIDIFGKASLYQYINRCESEQGKALLACNFIELIEIDEIHKRHHSIKELAPSLDWRQQLQSIARQKPVSNTIEKKVEAWLNDKSLPYASKNWSYFVSIYSLLTTASAIAAILDWIPSAIFSFLFLIYFIVALSLSKRVMKPYLQLSGVVKEVSTIYRLINWIEKPNFQSGQLIELQNRMMTEDRKASTEIKTLEQILNRFDLRLNVFVFLVLNSFLLWDVRQMRSLNKWKEKNSELLPQCFKVIGEIEVLNSLAVLHFNQPHWAFPQFENYFTLKGTAIGHLLIPGRKRVTSSFEMEGSGKIALVTGSNMAGKSTFLRSLGVNIILAQIGAPVCAATFTLSPMQLMSSMRIADNLAESTSTFYAELKKLEAIIDEVKQHRPLFVILDEILRGTNSLDRHIGSKALIRQLIKEKAVAVIATHDVELTELQTEFPAAIENYHFDVQVENDELYFDYQLKNGVCQSLNASILMKKIGIEL